MAKDTRTLTEEEINKLNVDIKDWQASSEAYRSDLQQVQTVLRNVIEAYDYCSADPVDRGYSVLNDAVENARVLVGREQDPA